MTSPHSLPQPSQDTVMNDKRTTDEIDALAQEIRRVDGENNLGAGALAEALMPFLTELQHRREAEAGAVEQERKRAIAAIHWVFSADGTKLERSMADDAINKINDPTFIPAAASKSSATAEPTRWPDLPEVQAAKRGLNALYLEAPEAVCRDVSKLVVDAFQAIATLAASPSSPASGVRRVTIPADMAEEARDLLRLYARVPAWAELANRFDEALSALGEHP
jgi:hypothetical protein